MPVNPQFDEYIAKSRPFARPVLEFLREVVHSACPGVQEEIKWSFPNFVYKGKILCSMAAFKEHCAFGFWLHSIMNTVKAIRIDKGESSGMGLFGKITSIKDLPSPKVLANCIGEAMMLIDEGVTLKKEAPSSAAELPVPEALVRALDENEKAKTAFEEFSPSQRKEYIQWINEAKTDATREKRVATTIRWVSEGKSRNWKYKKK